MLPKLMRNSELDIHVSSSTAMPGFNLHLSGVTSWPSVARWEDKTQMLSLFNKDGEMIYEHSLFGIGSDMLPNFGLVFVGVTESTVDFKTKTQRISAKMRVIDLDAHENIHGDNWGYGD